MQQLTKESMKKALSEMPTGFEDEDTVIQVEDTFTAETVAQTEDPFTAPTVVKPEPTPLTARAADKGTRANRTPADITPPPLPFSLLRKKPESAEDAWMEALPPEARAVLERAALPAPSWPFAPRLPGAVAQPTQKIPKLDRRSASC